MVVGAIDGMVYVLDGATGTLIHSFDTGGATVSAFRANKEAPMLVASANAADAQLFMMGNSKERGARVQQETVPMNTHTHTRRHRCILISHHTRLTCHYLQLNSTLRDIVQNTPFHDFSGHLYVGSEATRCCAVVLPTSD